MNRFIIKIANIYVEIHCRHDFTYKMCKDYIVNSDSFDIVGECSDEDIKSKLKESSEGYVEFISIYENIASKLPKYNCVLIHGAAIEYKNKAYLFLASSGTGKSTHINMWKQSISGVTIINGDKPIIDAEGNIYGTPWCGKEGWNTNKYSKLAGIVILNRDINNHIEKSNLSDNLVFILSQIFKSNNYEMSINIVDKAFKNIPIYLLGCNISNQAVKVCFDEIIK